MAFIRRYRVTKHILNLLNTVTSLIDEQQGTLPLLEAFNSTLPHLQKLMSLMCFLSLVAYDLFVLCIVGGIGTLDLLHSNQLL